MTRVVVIVKRASFIADAPPAVNLVEEGPGNCYRGLSPPQGPVESQPGRGVTRGLVRRESASSSADKGREPPDSRSATRPMIVHAGMNLPYESVHE
jgi:hypothetical protein